MAINESDLLAAYRRLDGPLYNVLYRWLWDAQECQDLSQETFMRVWKQRQKVDPARLDALIFATALNLAKNKLRWRRLWRFSEPDAETSSGGDEDPEWQAQRSADQGRVRRALESLDRDARNLLLLSEFSGLSGQELSEALQLPAGTIASRKHRALAALKKMLEPDHE